MYIFDHSKYENITIQSNSKVKKSFIVEAKLGPLFHLTSGSKAFRSTVVARESLYKFSVLERIRNILVLVCKLKINYFYNIERLKLKIRGQKISRNLRVTWNRITIT